VKLIECVPNFSEGRRQEVMDAIVNSMKESANVIILDVEADPYKFIEVAKRIFNQRWRT